ncbi:MAG: SDR family NAD(P)-dependent oxidoreductase [Aquificae bacterium]|nr:SDR family NAD(P)-dependent oxidoreductase [Aquificota bacterium]
MNLLITGVGSGLGKALAQEALKRGYRVYALGRHLPSELEGKIAFVRADLSRLEEVALKLSLLTEGIKRFELCILNAGTLGSMKDTRELSLREIDEVMGVNVWANKVIIDTLSELRKEVDLLIAISSGAAKNCNRGWGAYALSKSALNCLVSLYAKEITRTHFIALAPGLVLTPMLELVMSQDEERFPSVKRIKNSPKLPPDKTAQLIFEVLPKLKEFPSGSFVDLRDLPQYEYYIHKYGVY